MNRAPLMAAKGVTLLALFATGEQASQDPAAPQTAPTRRTVVHVEIPPLPRDTYVRLADEIVHGRVLFQMPVDPGDHLPYTAVDLEVLSSWKGNAPTRVTLHIAGARVGDHLVVVPSAPLFDVGDELVLFLSRETDPLGWEYRGVLGLERGTYHVSSSPDGNRSLVHMRRPAGAIEALESDIRASVARQETERAR